MGASLASGIKRWSTKDALTVVPMHEDSDGYVLADAALADFELSKWVATNREYVRDRLLGRQRSASNRGIRVFVYSHGTVRYSWEQLERALSMA